MGPVLKGVAYGSAGLVSLTAGGVWAAIRAPGNESRSLAQHVAAGTVFAGLVVDVFRRLLTTNVQAVWLVSGLVTGLGAMMLIRVIGEGASASTLGWTIVADAITDGLLMGLTGASGSRTSLLFVIGLAPEMLLLGAMVAEEFAAGGSALRKVAIPGAIGFAVVAGGALGGWARSGPQWLATGIEAFGAVAISYLVMEELLREAHREGDSPLRAAAFFFGFIPLFAAGVLLG